MSSRRPHLGDPIVLGKKQFSHHLGIEHLTFSPDGQLLASTGWDNTIRIWEVASGREIQRIVAEDFCRGLAFRPDGRTFGSLNSKGIRFWDIATGAAVAEFLPGQHFTKWALSPKGERLAAIDNRTLRILEVDTAREVTAIEARDGWEAVEFSPTGKIMIATDGRWLRVWDGFIQVIDQVLRGWARHLSLVQYDWLVNAVSLAEDMGMSNLSDAARILDVIHHLSVTPEYLPEEVRIPYCVRLKPMMFERSEELEEDLVCVTPPKYLFGNRDVFIQHLHSSARCSDEDDSRLKLWNLNKSPRPIILDAQGPPAISPDGRLVAGLLLNQASLIRIWDSETGEEVTRIEGHKSSVSQVRFSSRGDELMTGGEDGRVLLWSLPSASSRECIDCGCEIHYLSFSPDGSLLAIAAEDALHVWTTSPWSEKTSLDREDPIQCAVFSPVATTLVVDAAGCRLCVWNYEANVCSPEDYPASGRICECSISPDGRFVAVSSADFKGRSGGHGDALILWSMVEGKATSSIPHSWPVVSVAFSPRGDVIASGDSCISGDESRVRIWSRSGNRLIAELRGHGSRVSTLAFSRGGQLLASAGSDGAFAIWETATWSELVRVQVDGGPVRCIDFSMDAKRLAVALHDTSIAVFDLDSEIQALCR